MIKTVVDTNIFVSGLISETGAAAKLINFWEEKAFDILITDEVFQEYEQLFLSLDKVPKNKAKEFLQVVVQLAVRVKVNENFLVCKDLTDNKFIDCAVNGNADYLITKNVRHFPKDFQGVKVVKISKFLKVIEKAVYSP